LVTRVRDSILYYLIADTDINLAPYTNIEHSVLQFITLLEIGEYNRIIITHNININETIRNTN